MQRDIPTEFKELRLSGMAAAWQELTTHDGQYTDVGVQTSRWLIEHLLQAEHAHRAFASVRHQMSLFTTYRPFGFRHIGATPFSA